MTVQKEEVNIISELFFSLAISIHPYELDHKITALWQLIKGPSRSTYYAVSKDDHLAVSGKPQAGHEAPPQYHCLSSGFGSHIIWGWGEAGIHMPSFYFLLKMTVPKCLN